MQNKKNRATINYLSASLSFEEDRITYINTEGKLINVMMKWEDPIMSASAAYVCENGGDILEFGFGMGISADYIQSHDISSHTICEIHPQIIEKANEWAKDKPNVTIVEGSWYSNLDKLETYDGIWWDAGFTSDTQYFSSSLSQLTREGTRVTWWNGHITEKNKFPFFPQDYSFQKITGIKPVSNDYFDEKTSIYFMPKKEF